MVSDMSDIALHWVQYEIYLSSNIPLQTSVAFKWGKYRKMSEQEEIYPYCPRKYEITGYCPVEKILCLYMFLFPSAFLYCVTFSFLKSKRLNIEK